MATISKLFWFASGRKIATRNATADVVGFFVLFVVLKYPVASVLPLWFAGPVSKSECGEERLSSEEMDSDPALVSLLHRP